jgi:hypothetical protein
MQAMFGLWMSLGLAEIYMDLALWLTEPLVKLALGVQVLWHMLWKESAYKN